MNLHTHYVRSLLHPTPCGACGAGFAVWSDYHEHVKLCPLLQAERLPEYVEPGWELTLEVPPYSPEDGDQDGSEYDGREPMKIEREPQTSVHPAAKKEGSIPMTSEEGDDAMAEPGEDRDDAPVDDMLLEPSAAGFTTPSSSIDLSNITPPEATSEGSNSPPPNTLVIAGTRGPQPSASTRCTHHHDARQHGSGGTTDTRGHTVDSGEDARHQDIEEAPTSRESRPFPVEERRSSYLLCRLCSRRCDTPVATPCGHLFCHRCIAAELMIRTKCPVCQDTILLKLATD
ncbi:hypothetical protein C8Q76DRAFT_736694 [Earliella scabrosa]|nr:hypothetical protein C8Q76DRAFT_736694 [Earliella scabrosa]